MTGDAPPRFTDLSFAYFDDLSRNNSSDWFEAQREQFAREVDAPFKYLLADLSARLAKTSVPLRGSADTCFPMARDVRFTQDKTPYALHRAAMLTRSGRMTEAGAALYVQLAVGGGMAFCGFHALDAATLEPMRSRIVRYPDRFDDALEVIGEAGYSLVREDALPVMPRGFEGETDNRHASILRMKTLGVRRNLPRPLWASGEVTSHVELLARATMPLIAFFD